MQKTHRNHGSLTALSQKSLLMPDPLNHYICPISNMWNQQIFLRHNLQGNNGNKSGKKNSDRARPILWSTTKQQLEASDWLLLLWGKYSDLENCASADFFVTRQWMVHGCGALVYFHTTIWSEVQFWDWCPMESMLRGSSVLSKFRTSLSKVLTLWHWVKEKQRYHTLF